MVTYHSLLSVHGIHLFMFVNDLPTVMSSPIFMVPDDAEIFINRSKQTALQKIWMSFILHLLLGNWELKFYILKVNSSILDPVNTTVQNF